MKVANNSIDLEWNEKGVTLTADNLTDMVILRLAIEHLQDAGCFQLPNHLQEILDVFEPGQEMLINEIKDKLNLSSATMINNRVAKMCKLGLLERREGIIPIGGRRYLYRLIEAESTCKK